VHTKLNMVSIVALVLLVVSESSVAIGRVRMQGTNDFRMSSTKRGDF
jgi:hypothetical protein